MIIQGGEGRTKMNNSQCSGHSGVLSRFLCLLILSLPFNLAAQVPEQSGEPGSEPEQVLSEELAEVVVILPDSHQMALALATPRLRRQALLDLAVAASVLSRAENGLEAEVTVDHVALAQGFLDDRAWLQMLVDRYGWVQPHSSVLDPAAWRVLEELQQHDLDDVELVFPGRSPESVLVYQVFQRVGQRLAAANLPVLLLEVEADVIVLWDAFLQLTEVQEKPDAAWKVVELAWFTDRQILPLPVLEVDVQDTEAETPDFLQAISDLVLSAVDARPPDSIGLMQLRYSLLNEVPGLVGVENVRARDQVMDSLYLVSLVDGLHEGRYFDFIQGLLSITTRLLERPVNVEQSFLLVDWLVTELPAISAHYAVEFARVDPRLNAAMVATYEVLLSIAGFYENAPGINDAVNNDTSESGPGSDNPGMSDSVSDDAVRNEPGIHDAAIKASRVILADAVAQLALLVPDMGYYFDTPVRARIVQEVNACIGLAAGLDSNGVSVMTRRQFDACMETLLQLADRETRLAELSGDMNGPFTTDTLRRELSVTPWQRINYGIGYLDERFSTDCLPPAAALPNPLEWSVLANFMSWFAEHSPEFFDTTENEGRISKMRNIGEQLILALSEQSECLAAAGTGVNDLVSRFMTDYEFALRELDSGIKKAEADFRTQRLKTGADVSLEQGAIQKTGYRPDDLVIAPCDKREICEMSGSLSATRALIGLFPDEYLIAEQTGMGQIEICYRNMEWVQRRSELVRADDNNVANYFGRLGFDLVGRYVENKQVSDIFGFRFTSPEEHHYLFAQTSDEVLNDSCPVEWVGSRVVTPLRESRGGIVPDRLTYLAASRKLPSRLLQSNWDRGAEWRDWFVTGIGVVPLELSSPPEITTRLNQHLQSLYQAGQTEIYQRILLPNARNSQGDDVSLFNEMSQVSIAKALMRTQMMLFYPESLYNSDAIRMAIAGDAGLLERRTLRRFREDNTPLTSVNRIARERLNSFREVWLKQPESVRRQGSVPVSLMHALTRINLLYRQFFIYRPEPLQEIDVLAKPD